MTIVTSPANTAVKAAKKLLRRHGRDAADEFLVEGPALLDGADHLRRLFATEDAARSWIGPLAASGVDVITVDERVLAELADTVTCRGAVGVARMPRPSLTAVVDSLVAGGRLLIVDRVADPGNAGTLVRTADAAGFDAVVFTAGSVDVRHPKVVRASAGSIFHLPVADRVDAADVIAACASAGLRLIGAQAGAPIPYTEANLVGGCAIVVGNEAHGLSPVLAGALDTLVSIPMHGTSRPGHTGVAESLNLAVSAAVLMYETSRQRDARDDAGLVCENDAR